MIKIVNITLPKLPRDGASETMPPPLSLRDGPAKLEDWVKTVVVEPQGLAFRQRLETLYHLRGLDERLEEARADPAAAAKRWQAAEDNEANGADDDAEEAGGADERQQQGGGRRKKFVKLTEEDMDVDWYDVLKVEQGEGATDDQLRLAYRRRCLETHPDKQPNHSDELFKRVQRAFDILGDAEARLAYDSSRPFDDSIPSEVVAEADFYTVFGPVFDSNKKWSQERGLPSLGTDKMPHKDVLRFYERWNGYQSWRDFSYLADIQEIDDSMCREEKRYYMRENEREINHYKREEQKRIRALVDRARKNDPRLRRHREAEEQRRLKEVEDREAFRRQLREKEERKRMDQEEKAKAEKEAAVRKVQEAKVHLRQLQQSVVAFFSDAGLLDSVQTNKLFGDMVRRPNISWLFGKINDREEAEEAMQAITTAATDKVDPSTLDMEDLDASVELGKTAVEAVIIFDQLVLQKERHAGMTRYGEPVKKQPMVPRKKKHVDVAKTVAPTAPPVEWTEDDLNRLQKATAKYPPGSVERWSKICTLLRDRFTEEQAMAKVNELTAELQHVGGHSSATAAAEAATAAEPAANSASVGAGVVPAVEEWTVPQQKQLEQGLRDLKDYKDKDKFQKIAKMVEGKTAKECFERFKFLCSVNKKK